MGISDVSGIFKTFDLAVASQAKDFSDAKVNFSIDVNSIDTNVDARDNHLKVLTFSMRLSSTKLRSTVPL